MSLPITITVCTMPPASASVLSPIASPFHPRIGEDIEDYGVIYDGDGIPVMQAVQHQVLHNISDETLDDAFPPDATDAAELDAADDFVETMALLGLLEDHEEIARQDYSHALTKRELDKVYFSFGITFIVRINRWHPPL